MNIEDMSPEQLNALVHIQVMGKRIDEACESPYSRQETFKRCDVCGHIWNEDELDLNGYGPQTLYDTHTIPVPNYSGSMDAAWQIVEKMLARQEQEHYLKHFEWDGPRYKPSHHYLTNEGYPLNTVCWYVVLSVNDYRQFVCADTAPRAICYAALRAVGAIERDGTLIEQEEVK